jgi:hypothetical protein
LAQRPMVRVLVGVPLQVLTAGSHAEPAGW